MQLENIASLQKIQLTLLSIQLMLDIIAFGKLQVTIMEQFSTENTAIKIPTPTITNFK